MTRIAIVTDIHHGAPSHTKRGDTALDLLADFTRWANAEAPDLILDLGDRISDIDTPTDNRLEREVAEALSHLDAPIHHICGNHDRDHLGVADNEAILGTPLQSQVIDLGDWQLALWRADAKIHRNTATPGFDLPESDLLWLSRMAQQAEKPTLVASHVPVSGHSQIGNYYFQRNASVSTYPQADRARQALAQARVPVACIAGHVHWNTVTTVDGIPHMTQQSLTESFTTGGEPARAWGMLTLGKTLHWQVFGDDPFEARLTPGRRWTPPLAPFLQSLAAE
ncbi:metallophosphoesterase-domain-containing protein [Pseudooceanicola sediminis]|uniref:Metallophosphoesterase-domain-containing protein n=1 Tax=Pseudooceanicola sediminis TaxID=2211117 RepID=A0A399J659_9RHOB|nr:metallophosphoesterase [Pseudooceanicola sediminis]KAA2314327.1 metallophosphoesterase-domain-containing protein [Puniceibacterium sp. HSS470]RII39819.1 metallophosphoesterase-domain-containing protein [Pseudooceanicola sediminis]|tara:strand:- start:1167 stop:2009 length:843 start_codon:yes stop_codon:yes gene_type:complete